LKQWLPIDLCGDGALPRPSGAEPSFHIIKLEVRTKSVQTLNHSLC